MLAYGTLDLVGVQNADITGSVRLEINTTANDATVDVLDDTPAAARQRPDRSGCRPSCHRHRRSPSPSVQPGQFSADLELRKGRRRHHRRSASRTPRSSPWPAAPSPSSRALTRSGVSDLLVPSGLAGSIDVAVEAATNTTGLEFEANITAAFNSSSAPASSPLLAGAAACGSLCPGRHHRSSTGNPRQAHRERPTLRGQLRARGHRFRPPMARPSGSLPPASPPSSATAQTNSSA